MAFPFHLPLRRAGLLLLMVAFAALVYWYRLELFGDMEPRSDQAFFVWWVRGMVDADHFLPLAANGEGWYEALTADTSSFLNQLLRPLYNAPTVFFQILTVVIHYLVAVMLGSDFYVHVGLSVFANAATILLVMTAPWWPVAGDPLAARTGWRLAASVLAGVLVATSAHLHSFVPLGHHNFGVLMLVAAAAYNGCVTAPLVGDSSAGEKRKGYLMWLLLQGCAIYAYKTNLFVLPLATAIWILTRRGLGAGHRVRLLLGYCVVMAILVLPFLPLLASQFVRPEFSRAANFLGVAAIGGDSGLLAYATSWAARAVNWFEAGAQYFSTPGFIAGLAGLVLLSGRNGNRFPLIVVAAHFLVWSSISLVAETGYRTYLYVIPFLAVGHAYLAVAAFAGFGGAPFLRATGRIWPRALSLLGSGFMLVHLAGQAPVLTDNSRIENKFPVAWHTYFRGQGELRPMITDVQRRLPDGAVLLTWGYGLQYLYRTFRREGASISVIPALHALALREDAGLLKSHLRHRRLRIDETAAVYLLVDRVRDNVDINTVRGALTNILGPAGFGWSENWTLEKLKRWEFRSFWPKDVTMYRVWPRSRSSGIGSG